VLPQSARSIAREEVLAYCDLTTAERKDDDEATKGKVFVSGKGLEAVPR
jgi:hypothetical protein